MSEHGREDAGMGRVQWVPLYVQARDLKMMRESLCLAQALLLNRPSGVVYAGDARHLSRLIAEIDEHRPLGVDGTHGDLHTATCGCDLRNEP